MVRQKSCKRTTLLYLVNQVKITLELLLPNMPLEIIEDFRQKILFTCQSQIIILQLPFRFYTLSPLFHKGFFIRDKLSPPF